MPCPPLRFHPSAAVLAPLCALVTLAWMPATQVRAEPAPEPVVVLAQADPPAKEELPESSGGGYVAPPSDVEVIRIKGRGVEAIQTDVPESVTQFDAAEIEALGAQNISDLAKVTPNVEIKTAGATAPTFFIRGVGLSDFSSNAAGSVAIYQDDVPINAAGMQLGVLYDIANVAVERGPTGYGTSRNDAAGAIKIYTREPTGELSASLRSRVGRFNLRDFEGAIEAPLVEEVLSARLAFRLIERDGYVKNGCGTGFTQSGLPLTAPVDPTAEFTPRHPSGDPRSPEEVLLNPTDIPAGGDVFRGYVGPPVAPRGGRRISDYSDDFNAVIYAGQVVCGENSVKPNEYRLNNDRPRAGTGEPGGVTLDRRSGLPRLFKARMFISPIPTGLEEMLNNIGTWAARGQIRYQPQGADMDWLLKLHGSRLDQLSTVGQAVGTKGSGLNKFFGNKDGQGYRDPDIGGYEARFGVLDDRISTALANDLDPDPWRGDYNRTGDTLLDIWGTSLRGDWDLGPANLRSISAFDTYERFRDTDQDFTPNVVFEEVSEDSAWQFYQELKLEGELADSPLRWNTGGYYLMEEVEFFSQTVSTAPGAANTRIYDQNTFSFAFWAGFEWDFLDDFTLSGGARYQWQRADFDFSLTKGNAPQDPFFGSETWHAPTGQIALQYRLGEEANLYWKYTRGWKPGTWNSSSNLQRGVNAADPVQIDAWETGLRGSWFDGRFSLGASLFYYRYVDYQVFVVLSEEGISPTLTVLNADDAEVYGGELDFQLEPLIGWAPGFMDGLVMGVRLGWLESEFLEFTNQVQQQVGFLGSFLSTVDYAHNPILNAPRFKASGNAEWTFDLGRYGSIIPRYDFSWSDDISFGPNDSLGTPNVYSETFIPEHGIGQRAFWLHNLRFTYRTPEGNAELAIWVRNLENFAYKTYAFDASSFQNVVVQFVGEPRTFGLDITFHW